MILTTKTADETFNIGMEIGEKLVPGDIVALKGDLGAGKTVITKGIASALNIKEDVTSPTYNIVCEYSGSLPLYHMDLYRISDIEEFEMLGVENLIYGQGITVIEWSERILEYLPSEIITISILRDKNNETREIEITGLTLWKIY